MDGWLLQIEYHWSKRADLPKHGGDCCLEISYIKSGNIQTLYRVKKLNPHWGIQGGLEELCTYLYIQENVKGRKRLAQRSQR